MAAPSRTVLMAAVIGAQGLKGEVKVKTFTETPGALARYRRLHAKDGRVFTIAQFRPGNADEATAAFAEVLDLIAERLHRVGREVLDLGLLQAHHVRAGLLQPLDQPGQPGQHRIYIPGSNPHPVIQAANSDNRTLSARGSGAVPGDCPSPGRGP